MLCNLCCAPSCLPCLASAWPLFPGISMVRQRHHQAGMKVGHWHLISCPFPGGRRRPKPARSSPRDLGAKCRDAPQSYMKAAMWRELRRIYHLQPFYGAASSLAAVGYSQSSKTRITVREGIIPPVEISTCLVFSPLDQGSDCAVWGYPGTLEAGDVQAFFCHPGLGGCLSFPPLCCMMIRPLKRCSNISWLSWKLVCLSPSLSFPLCLSIPARPSAGFPSLVGVESLFTLQPLPSRDDCPPPKKKSRGGFCVASRTEAA